MVVDADGLSFEDSLRELEIGHVGAAPGSVDGKKPQARGFQAVEVAVGVGHQFVRFFCRRVKADGIIDVGRFLKGELVAISVYRRTGGVDKVLDLAVSAALEDVQKADDVGIDILVGVVEGVAHAGLGGQVYDPVEAAFLEKAFHRRPVFQLHADKAEFRIFAALYRRSPGFGLAAYSQLIQAGEFELGVVIAVDGIYAYDAVAFFEEALCRVKAYETGGTGDEDAHLICLLPDRKIPGIPGFFSRKGF